MKRFIGAAFVATAALLSANSAVAQDQVLLSSAGSKSGSAISIDLMTSGSAVGFNFIINVPADVEVDTSACLKYLPKSFTGRCAFKDSEVRVIAFSEQNVAMKAGANQIGLIRLFGLNDAKALQVRNVEIVNSEAKSISDKALIQ